MYNANMHNATMHNMMPCIPIPCVPPYCYPVPYPSMLPNYPVNHMAAGLYCENGCRSRRHKRKSRSKGDENVKYKPHHRQHHVVSRQRYYLSSPESDSEDERPDTWAKRAPACRSVSRKIIADKSSHTLSHSSPMSLCSGVEPHRSNMTSGDFIPSTPLQQSVPKVDIAVDLSKVRNNTTVTHHSHSQLNTRAESTQRASLENECHVGVGNAAVLQKSPSKHPYIQNSVMAVNIYQQEEPTLAVTNDEDFNIFASNDTVPLNHIPSHGVSNTTNNQLTVQLCSDIPSYKSSCVVPSIDTSTSSASCESQPVDSNLRTATQMEIMSALHVTSAAGTKTTTAMTSYVDSKYSTLVVNEDDQYAQSAVKTETTISRALDTHGVSTVQPGQGDNSTSVRPSNPNMDQIWRNAACSLKYLQSLHSLRKTWLEWETKYRPPPVSVYTGRGAGP